MRRLSRSTLVCGMLALVTSIVGVSATASAKESDGDSRHVLLISVDGLHQSDLDWFVSHHPASALARLVGHGMSFTRARTPVPSDSFPGLLAQVTGGNPRSTGVYYDDSFNPNLLPAGTTDCVGAVPGAELNYSEFLDRNGHSIDAGQGLSGLPASILSMTSHPEALIDPANLPVDPTTCTPVYPHSYLQVNTVFEVARAAGLRTAWSDKHPAYEILNGPSGQGVQDLFTPEINSDAPTLGAPIDWTKDNALTQQYDGYKVAAVVNEIGGFDHTGAVHVGTPAIFGMNFQSVSTAEKLPSSGGQPGGYLADGTTPGPVLSSALDFIDASIAKFQAALDVAHLGHNTTIILSAKHGQSPTDPASLTRIPDGPILDALDAAWNAAKHTTSGLVAFSINDDAMVIWLKDRSSQATTFAKDFLTHYTGVGNDINSNPKAFTSAGLSKIYSGRAAAKFFGVHPGNIRVPDLYGVAQHGVVYTGGHGKIAEHGGADAQDRRVPIVISGHDIEPGVNRDNVETTQIAPTILELLGLDPEALTAVRLEGTEALPLD